MSRTHSTPAGPDPLLGPRLRDANRHNGQDEAASHVADLLTRASHDFAPKRTASWARIESAIAARSWLPVRRRWLWPAIAMTSLSVATAAVAGPALVGWFTRNNATTSKPHVAIARPVVVNSTAATTVMPAPAAKTAEPSSPPPKRTPARRLSMVQPPSPAPSAASALAEESRLLGRALSALRKHKDTTQTLALLDNYDRTFPRGALAREAEHTRVEALLIERRTTEALGVLDRSAFASRDRDLQWRVLRGELRAQAHRCAEALADFAAVLQTVNDGSIAERALYGRASCFIANKDDASAESALRQYVERFPAGVHAVQARKALQK